jgi:hypothetical protein
MSSMAIDRPASSSTGADDRLRVDLFSPTCRSRGRQRRPGNRSRPPQARWQLGRHPDDGWSDPARHRTGRATTSPSIGERHRRRFRRPGSFALAFDIHDRREPVLFTTPANRHFYGHGVFSRDGRLLYATEHDNETRQGLIGVYNATAGFKRIGEMPTYGIGPHEVILLADGKTLAVANGGIETHIETGREKLNLDSMQPSLAFVDSTSGALIAQHKQSSELHKLSIRIRRRMRAASLVRPPVEAPTPRRRSSSAAPASISRCASCNREIR